MPRESTGRHAQLLAEIGLPQRSRKGSLEAVLEVVEGLPRGRALDLPSGPGLLAEALRRLGFEVTAADIDPEGFALRDTIPFRQADLDGTLPFADRSFDLVHCGDGIEHLENPSSALRELARVLDAGGTLVVTTPNYLCLESRLRFLLTGSLTKPLPRPVRPPAPKSERGHIGPLTLTRLAWLAEEAGLDLVASKAFLAMPRQWLLLPLALPVWLARAFLPARYRRDLYANATLSWNVLLGGRKILAIFRRSPERSAS